MMQKITLPEIVAYNNTPKAKALVVRYGYNSPINHTELVQTLVQFMKDYRKEALEEMAKIHPHKDLISEFIARKENKSKESGCNCHNSKKQRFSNFALADEYIDFDGSSKNKNMKLDDYLPIIAVAGIFALTIVSLNKS